MENNKKITIYDIAREAAVSPATVSRVLTNSAKVNEDKKKRIQEIIDKYHYRPNAIARSLSEARRKVIGIVVPDVRNPYFASLFVACEKAASEAGYSLFLANSLGDHAKEEAILRLMEDQCVDAIIYIGGYVDDLYTDPEFAEKVRILSMTIPMVLVGKLDGTLCPQVRINSSTTMDLIMEHLLSLGHKEIAIVGGWNGVTSTYEKRMRYKQILAKHNLPVRSEFYETEGGYDYETGYKWTKALLKCDVVPTAIIGINDPAAIGVINCLQSRGYRVPEDIAVVGFDNTNLCEMSKPALTSIDYNYEEYGRELIATVDKFYNGSQIPSVKLIEPSLVVRTSTKK